MDRSTTLQRLGSVVFFSVMVAVMYFQVDLFDYKSRLTQIAYFCIFLVSGFLFFLLNIQPFSKIIFDHLNDRITYYRFLLFKKCLTLSSIEDVKGQTKISHRYGGGKSRTLYTNDVFLISNEGDYQVRVFERAKIQEFKLKFDKAKSLINSQSK